MAWLTSLNTSLHVRYHAEYGRSALKDVGINTEEPQNWGALEVRSVGWKAWLTPRYTPLPDICYHIKFGSSLTKGVCTNRKEPPNWGALGPRPLRIGCG